MSLMDRCLTRLIEGKACKKRRYCGGPPSSLSREGPQFPSSLTDYASDRLFHVYCLLPN